ncbi:hypothetical protein HYH03_000181 [Edaphochlamys debaryana]|uniref:Uncharacterized protein n=1 Tax=Edaphochlamys debaryana TaxID=47281 RepID=A0A835YFD0_9CHLO|nr:hypothetical protein HYH03_000181 [Edaphochlamys debaryana]|eukprot:KAG2501678.1 hypothetical protein HYH03_000181 [Edaphochlamys debaryana]
MFLHSIDSGGESTDLSSVQLAAKPLLTVLKAVPADILRSNLACAFGRLSDDADSNAARPPITPYQWLPGQWTPVLYGLSRDFRAFTRTVLTHTLTVDLAIAVSLQRPDPGSSSAAALGGGFNRLESFLAGFPCLQRLTVLAGNGGAPVDDSPRPASAHANTGSSTPLTMAEPVSVALAAQMLLQLDRPEQLRPSEAGLGTGAGEGGPKLTQLELRLHPAVWRELRGSDPKDFLQRLASTHPHLEALTLHVAAPAPPGVMSPTPSMAGGLEPPAGAVSRVGLSALTTLTSLRTLRLAGTLCAEGLEGLTQLQVVSLEGINPSASHTSLQSLRALTSLRITDTHHRAGPISIDAPPPQAVAAGRAAASMLSFLRSGPAAPLRLRSLYLPDVFLAPRDWAALQRLAPHLRELELAAATPPPYKVHSALTATDDAKRTAHMVLGTTGTDAVAPVVSTAGSTASGGVPDWYTRATGDDGAPSQGRSLSGSQSGGPNSVGRNSHGSNQRVKPVRRPSDSSDSGDERPIGAPRCPFAAVFGAGDGAARLPEGHPAVPGGGAAGNGASSQAAVAMSSLALPGLRRLVMWQYLTPAQMVEVLQLMPDLRDLHASLLLDDPAHTPAAQLRTAAVSALRPLIAVLRQLRHVRLAISCDPAAVTGQLACVFLVEAGLADVVGIRGLTLTVWVAAETQLGGLAVLEQLRSLELTLGKQEQESELSVLTRLVRLSYLSLRITPGPWNEIQGRTGRVTAGAALRLAMSFCAGQVLLLVADVHREICEEEAISLVKSVEMTSGQVGAAWAVSAWVEETAECIMGFVPGGGAMSGTGGGGPGGAPAEAGVVLRVVWTPELVRRLLGVVAGVEGCGGLGGSVSFMSVEEERLGRVLGS